MLTTKVNTLSFSTLKLAFQSHFTNLLKEATELYQTDADKDILWQTYLQSFPEELRQHYNCNCCRQFIKNYGNLVIIKDYKIVSLWDFQVDNSIFQKVIDNMRRLITCTVIVERFIPESLKLGTDYNYETPTIKWDHLYYQLPRPNFVSTPKAKAEYRDNKKIFKRGLDELTIEATETVLELIGQGSLYRGEEHRGILEAFLKLQKEYAILTDSQKDNYCWVSSKNGGAISRIRNSGLGTFLIDLSKDMDLDEALRRYEKVFCPTNYKRPKAIFSKKQVEQAEQKLKELGLSIGRKFATKEDITVNNVLFVDRNIRSNTSSNPFDQLKDEAPVNTKSLSKVEAISLEQFLTEVVPKATNIEVLLESKHQSNLVSLIAPMDMDAPSLLKWDNGFSWSYNNNLADSLKEKVKAAGGRVDGELRISLEWYNYDDLDLHVYLPNGRSICFSSPDCPSGKLDVDYNAYPQKKYSRTPVENVIFPNAFKMEQGRYKIQVNQFRRRETADTGFSVEIECRGEVYTFTGQTPTTWAAVTEFHYSRKDGVIFPTTSTSQPQVSKGKELWGLTTGKFHKVNTIMHSPNHWDSTQNAVGLKHTFFMLEGMQNTTEVRGFFNEFLKEELLEHKRVFEALGNKMIVAPSTNQLSGIGFSHTGEFICKVTGTFNRTLKVVV